MSTIFDPRGFNFDKLLSYLYIYTGIFIIEEERRKLLYWLPPKHKNVYADHVTLCFKPSQEQVMEVDHWTDQHDEYVRLYMTKEVKNEHGHALQIECPDFIEHPINVTSPILHITMSCADGVSPVYSNTLLNKDFTDKIITPIKNKWILGRLGVCAQTDRNHLSSEICKRRGLAV